MTTSAPASLSASAHCSFGRQGDAEARPYPVVYVFDEEALVRREPFVVEGR
jgi:hypothetical protein